MFLERIELENVRSIAALDLPLSHEGRVRPWTMLLGENGAGKSTVLRAVALALAGSEALPELLADSDRWIRRGARHAAIRLALVTAAGEKRRVELRLRRGDSLAKTFDLNRSTLEELDDALAHTARNYFCVGYGVSRRASAAFVSRQERLRHPRARSVATLFDPDALLQPVESWAMDLDYRRPAQARAILRGTFAQILPGMGFAGIDKQKRELLFDTPDGRLPLAALSDGYQNIIAWCGDLLFRITETFADYKSPLAARGLLLIDEVDLHLHPLWQRKLQSFLRGKLPGMQVLASTHSPLTAHQAEEGELFMLRRPSPKAPPELKPFPGDPRKLLLHQFLMSPAFGLETADSVYVEHLKSGSPKGDARVELADLPRWEMPTPLSRERLKLLTELKAEVKRRS